MSGLLARRCRVPAHLGDDLLTLPAVLKYGGNAGRRLDRRALAWDRRPNGTEMGLTYVEGTLIGPTGQDRRLVLFRGQQRNLNSGVARDMNEPDVLYR
jgi:hypothetical protein